MKEHSWPREALVHCNSLFHSLNQSAQSPLYTGVFYHLCLPNTGPFPFLQQLSFSVFKRRGVGGTSSWLFPCVWVPPLWPQHRHVQVLGEGSERGWPGVLVQRPRDLLSEWTVSGRQMSSLGRLLLDVFLATCHHINGYFLRVCSFVYRVRPRQGLEVY